MIARDTAAAANSDRLATIKRLTTQAACLPSMLASIEFIHPDRQEEMLIECGNFAEDIGKALSQLMREAL